MPIKNYTTEVTANRSIEEIQSSLIKHGAIGISYQYEKGTGRVSVLHFGLTVKDKAVNFSLPVSWKKFQQVLKNQRVNRWDDEDYVYRVSWRNIRDWVLAQMAMFETQMVELPQVFLPFATGKSGGTLYEEIMEGKFLLGDGK